MSLKMLIDDLVAPFDPTSKLSCVNEIDKSYSYRVMQMTYAATRSKVGVANPARLPVD